MNWQTIGQNWLGPTLVIAILSAALSIGALYNRVATLEDAKGADRLARIETTIVQLDKSLARIERKLDRERE